MSIYIEASYRLQFGITVYFLSVKHANQFDGQCGG